MEDYLMLDTVGAAQAPAEWWAARQRLEPRAAVAEQHGTPRGTAVIASCVADLQGAELAGFLAGLPPREGVDGASVVDAIVGFEKVVRWAQAMQLRWVGELAARREDGRTGWARDASRAAAAALAAETSAAGVPAALPPTGGDAAAAGESPPVGETAEASAEAGATDLERLRTPGEDLLGRVGEHAAAEVAFALHTTRRAATDLLHAAVTLTRRLPLTLRAVERGDVATRAAVVAAEETCVLNAAAVAAVDEVLVERISGATVPQARERIRRAVVSADPIAAAAREVRARRCRSFDVDRRVLDGMGTFGGYAPIEDVVAIDERVDALARAAKCPGDGRSAGARRMDVVRDLLLGRPVVTVDETVAVEPLPARTWKVDVVVAESTLRGADEEPGELSGYGPITAPTARRLAGLAVAGLRGGQRPASGPDDHSADGHNRGLRGNPSGERSGGPLCELGDDPAAHAGPRRGRAPDVGAVPESEVGQGGRVTPLVAIGFDVDEGALAAADTHAAWPQRFGPCGGGWSPTRCPGSCATTEPRGTDRRPRSPTWSEPVTGTAMRRGADKSPLGASLTISRTRPPDPHRALAQTASPPTTTSVPGAATTTGSNHDRAGRSPAPGQACSSGRPPRGTPTPVTPHDPSTRRSMTA